MNAIAPATRPTAATTAAPNTTPTVFVTGDVHDPGVGGADARALRRGSGLTELECALKYAAIARRHRVPITLFVTGEAAQQQPQQLAELVQNEYVELGGHTWNALQPVARHLAYRRLLGSFYGPERSQRRDVRATIDGIAAAGGGRIRVWRTHGYRSDATTMRVLDEAGIRVVSDRVEPEGTISALSPSLVALPISTPPDHDHLLHGETTAQRVWEEQAIRESPHRIWGLRGRRSNWGRFAKELAKRAAGIQTPLRPFGEQHLPAADWWEWTRGTLDHRLERYGFATLLLHPACMELLDGMQLLDRVFAELSRRHCRPVSASPELLP